MKNKRTIESVS